MKKPVLWTIAIILIAAFLRFYSALNIPASGDETITLIQAAGQAHELGTFFKEHSDTIIAASDLKPLIDYSEAHGPADVAESMKTAGMHPPLYYFFIHYVMKYFGNDTYLLRCVSVLFSLGSVLAVYLIGKEIKNETLGLAAALLFALSTYGIKFSLMIRPYPAVMFMALLSTWTALRWAKNERFEFKDPYYWVTLAISIAGFYSIYHFVFYLVFLWSFLFFKALRQKKDMLVILSIPGATAAAFSLWVPSLRCQMNVVNQGHYYFNSLTNPIAGIGQQLTLNFTKYLPFKIIPSLFVLAFLLVLGLAGLWSILKSENGKFLVGAIILYVLANTGLDLMMQTNTIGVAKLGFFLNPFCLIVLAAGGLFIKDRFSWKIGPCLILIILAGVHSFLAGPYNPSIDGPYDKKLIADLNQALSSAGPKLAVINQPRRRYVFPLIHEMESPPDFVFTGDKSYPEKLASLDTLTKFDRIMIIFFDEDPASDKTQGIQPAQHYLETRGYRVQAEYPCVMGRIIVLEKDVLSEPGPSGPADTASRHPGSRNHICSFAQN